MQDCLTEMVPSSANRVGTKRRATVTDALDLATATHMAGRRIDMGTLARELGVGRATLYRWFSSREALIEEVLLARAETYVQQARRSSHSDGDGRLMEIARAMVAASQAARPVRLFIEREPTLALRILAGEHGRLHRFFVEAAIADLTEARSAAPTRAEEARVDATVQLIAAVLWVAVAIGDEPPVARIEALVREALMESAPRHEAGGR